jgi:4-amino-4-deoxy-L-arabinose transferase-like glycosyltransferase
MTSTDTRAGAPPRLPAMVKALERLYNFATDTRGFWILLAVYLTAHAALRLWASPNIGTDEVEQALFAQSWSWGYNPRQPPLFTWLLLASYRLFGPGMLAHVMLKYAALGLMYGCAYRCARRLVATPTTAALATFALLLIYGFGWGVHTGVTHTLVLSTLIFATLLALLRLVEHRRVGDYLLFGVAAGLGLLTKYSYGFFIGPLLCACLTVPSIRDAVFARRALIALAAAFLIILPHGLWMLIVGRDYGATLAELGAVGARHAYLANVATGLGSLAEASALFLAPLWIVALVLFWPAFRRPGASAQPWLRVLAAALAIGMGLLVLTVLIAEVTYFKDRRMHALLLIAPLLLFLWLDHREIEPWRLRWLAAAAGGVVLIVFVILLGQAMIEPYTCRRCWLHMPLPALEQAIRQSGFERGTIVAEEEHVGGNLRLAFPAARVLSPAYPTLDVPATGAGACLLAWHAHFAGDAIPSRLLTFLDQRFQLTPSGTPIVLDLPMMRRADRLDRFAYLIVPNADGDCRPL